MTSESDVDRYPSPVRATDGDDDPSDEGLSPRTKKRLMYAALVIPGILLLVIAVATSRDDKPGGTRDAAVSTADGTSGDRVKGGAEDLPKPKAWEPVLNGRPAALGDFGVPAADVKPGAAPGLYLWSDFGGWHLWAVAGEGVPNEVSGSITSDGDLQSGQLAVDGSGTVETDGKVINFALTTDRPVVGIDFNLWFYATTVTVSVSDVDGKPVELPIRLGTPGTEKALPLELRKG